MKGSNTEPVYDMDDLLIIIAFFCTDDKGSNTEPVYDMDHLATFTVDTYDRSKFLTTEHDIPYLFKLEHPVRRFHFKRCHN